MSILEKIKLPFGRPLTPAVEKELHAAEADLQALEVERGTLALAVALGEADAGAAMDAYRTKVEALRQRVSDLRAAHAAARERDQQADRERVAKARASQIASLKTRLHARDDLTLKLSVAISNAAMHWQDIIEANKSIHDLLTEFGVSASGSLVDIRELRAAVAAELFRVGAGHPGPNNIGFPHRFPGGAVADIRLSGDPDAVPALHEEAKRATAYVITKATGAPLAPPPLTLEPKPALTTDAGVEAAPMTDADVVASLQAAGAKTIDARAYTPQKRRLS